MQDDFIRPFQLDKAGLRGRLVRLGGTVDEILNDHNLDDGGQAALLRQLASRAEQTRGIVDTVADLNDPSMTSAAACWPCWPNGSPLEIAAL